MNEMLKALINVALLADDSHEYSINNDGKLEGYSHVVEIWGRAYVVEGLNCSACDGSHVNCHEFERVTTDPVEALENLQLVNAISEGALA